MTSPTTVPEQQYGGRDDEAGAVAQSGMSDGWSSYDGYQGSMDMDAGGGYAEPFVQPHINPRFASSFGLDLGYMQGFNQMQMPQFNQYGGGGYWNGGGQNGAGQGWSNDWNYSNGNGQYDQPGR